MNDADAQLNLRLPRALRDSLAEAAKRNHRSLTAETVVRLEASLLREGIDPATGALAGRDETNRMIGSLSSRLEEVLGMLERQADPDKKG